MVLRPMPRSPLELTRAQILAFRRRVGALDKRLPRGARSLRQAAWAGLQDSMPRAALLSIHARVEGTQPTTWEDQALVQVWGPRFSVFVVPAQDHALFTLARLPADPRGRERAEAMAARVHGFLRGRRMTDREVGKGLDVGNRLRYATATGTILIRWEGARAPVIWTVPAPEIEPLEARRELARRYLHIYGPTTPQRFARWAGIGATEAAVAFETLGRTLTPVRTPIGDAWILSRDEASIRDPPRPAAPARLLPSGDAYWLLQGEDRELLVPDPAQRGSLWTPRVWPGAVLVSGEILGTWRRAHAKLTIEPWRRITPAERAAVEAEAQTLPLTVAVGRLAVHWDD
jgi:winged helix DNA-binding protein